MFSKRFHKRVLAAAVAVAMPFTALAADSVTTLKKELEQLKKEVSELRALIQQQRQQAATKQEVQQVKKQAATKEEVKQVQNEVKQVKTESEHGEMLSRNSLVHLGGYGAVGYSNRTHDTRGFSMVNFNPIFHYQYKDLVFLESELETSVEQDGSTDVALEYANINFLLGDHLTLFGGKFLTPVGFFFQNLHPAWINKFPSRPPGWGDEGGAAPESDVGFGARGGFRWGDQRLTYAVYGGNGPRLELNDTGDEIEAIEAEGSTSNPSKRPTFAGRVGYRPLPQLDIGVSAGWGKVAVSESGMTEPRRGYNVYGADVGFEHKGLGLRGEYIQQHVDNEDQSVAPEGGTWKAWYAQASYRIPGTKFEPVLRYGDHKSPHEDQRLKQWGLGLDYWFSASAVAKIGYEINSGEAGTTNDEDRLLLQLGYGF